MSTCPGPINSRARSPAYQVAHGTAEAGAVPLVEAMRKLRMTSVKHNSMSRLRFSSARRLVHRLRLALLSRRPTVALNVVLFSTDLTAGPRDFRCDLPLLPAGQEHERGTGFVALQILVMSFHVFYSIPCQSKLPS
jgi:hypothetical protein